VRWVFVLVGLGCAGGSWIAGARDQPYDVHGKTATMAYNSVLRNGPVVDGDRKAAVTRYAFTPRVRIVSAWHEDGATCTCRQTVRGAHVELALEEVYPHWVESTSQSCQISWGTFLHHLREHELEHVKLAREMASTWADELNGLSATDEARQCPAACAHADEKLGDEIDATNQAAAAGHAVIQLRVEDHESIVVEPCDASDFDHIH
jgi:predicted secreted Zn-dependent protease